MRVNLRLAMVAACAALPIGMAQAHTSYMLPSKFSISSGTNVTLQCAFTEDFFKPDIVVTGADFHVITPDGAREEFDNIVSLKQMAVMEEAIEDEGTYRFTTGVRLGRKGKRALIDGEWRSVRGDIPENAEATKTTQTETVADVYVSKGAPNWTAAQKNLGRLVFTPLVHPNEIYIGEDFSLEVEFDGSPLVGHEMSIYRQGGDYEEPKYKRVLETNESGVITHAFSEPGIYLVMTRHRADAPQGSETDERSYTTSLTFEVSR